MFCRYCASPIPEDAAICPQCGREQFPTGQPQRPAVAPTTQQDSCAPLTAPSKAEVVWHTGYHQKVYAKLCRRIAVCGVLTAAVAAFLLLIFTLDSLKFFSESIWLVIIYVALFVEMAFLLIVRCLQRGAVKRTKLTVTESGIFGAGGNARYTASVPFELTFSQVKKVSSLPKHLVIDAEEKQIYCLIEDSKQAEQVIDDRLRRLHSGA